MDYLSDKDIDRVHDVLVQKGVSYSSLRIDLLDHICCLIEEKMDRGDSFERALLQSIKQFGPQGIERTHEATIHLLTLKLRKMKKFVSVLGLIGGIIAVFGALGKPLHLPGSGISLVLGIGILTAFYIPLYMSLKIGEANEKLEKAKVVAGGLSSILLGIGMLFALQHWPMARILLFSGMTLLCLVFIPLYFIRSYRTADNKFMSISFVVVVLAGILVSFGTSIRSESSTMTNSYQLIEAQSLAASESSSASLHYLLSKPQSEATANLLGVSEKTVTYINDIKAKLIAATQKVTEEQAQDLGIMDMDWTKNSDKISEIMLASEGEHTASELKAKLTWFLSQFNEVVENTYEKDELNRLIDLGETSTLYGESVAWESAHFDHVVIVPVVLYLEQLETEVNALTSQALMYQLGKNP